MNISKQQIFDLIDSSPVVSISTVVKGKGYLPIIDEYCALYNLSCQTISEKIFVYRNGITNNKCECGSGKNKRYVSYAVGYSCGCGKKCPVTIRTQTANRVETLKKNGGVGFARKDIIEKAKCTTMERYGVENISMCAERKEELKSHNPMFSEENKQKMRNTVFEKYGVGCVFENTSVKNRILETNNKKYGVDNAGALSIEKALTEKMRIKYNSFQNLFSIQPLFSFEDYSGIGHSYQWKCSCGNVFEQELTANRLYPICRECEPVTVGRSSQEIKLYEFVKDSCGCDDASHNVRDVISGELDIFIPSKKMAIEFCGAYWHSERFDMDSLKHFKKWKQCADIGIQLLTIFDDEYNDRKDAIHAYIKNKLTDNTRIYARKCVVKQCTNDEAKEFLCKNHIQGYAQAKYHYGLYCGEKIISCISFSSPRKGIGNSGGGFELVRFASESGIVVVGGFSKLVKHFVEEVNPTHIYSFSDNRYSNGRLYEKNGFLMAGDVVPRYRYLNPSNGKLEHRFKYAKFKLVEKGCETEMTERQIMENAGFFRVWDCGKKKWVLDIR